MYYPNYLQLCKKTVAVVKKNYPHALLDLNNGPLGDYNITLNIILKMD